MFDEGRLAASFHAVAGSPGVVFFDKDLRILGTVSERCNQGFDVLPAAMRGAGGRFVRAKTTIAKSPDSVSCAFDVVDLEV